jgi:CDP-paratose 2-epimerase
VRGRIFNLGGGSANAVSLLELVDLIAELRGEPPEVRFSDRRPGDQPWYVSDIRAIAKAIGWQPRVTLRAGLPALERWLEGRYGRALRIEQEFA